MAALRAGYRGRCAPVIGYLLNVTGENSQEGNGWLARRPVMSAEGLFVGAFVITQGRWEKH